MVSEKASKNAGFIQIIITLISLREKGIINPEEYEKAREYYYRLTGADISLADSMLTATSLCS